MNTIMIHLPAKEPELSINFYRKLGFVIHADELDGAKNRCVRMKHLSFPQVLINFGSISLLADQPRLPALQETAFSIVVDDCTEWINIIEHAQIKPEKEIIEPWGIWIYIKDPNSNRFCITNNSLW